MASKYRERVEVGRTSDGQAIYKGATGSTRQELNASIIRLMNDANAQAANDIPVWEVYADKWFHTYQRTKVRKKTSVTQECVMRNHVTPAFAGMRLNTIRASDIQNVLNSKQGLSKAYVRDIMWLMSQVFQCAVYDEYISKNPMDAKFVFNPSKRKEQVREALTPEAQADIIASIPKLKKLEDRRFMARLMYTPMRPSEIFGLRWERIDLQAGLIHIVQAGTFINGHIVIDDTKNEYSKRVIPLDKQLVALLEQIQTEGYVIARTAKGFEGDPMSEQAAKRQWQRIKKTIDVHGMTPYVGRHTYATNKQLTSLRNST